MKNLEPELKILNRRSFQIGVLLLVVLLTSNINAVVDSVLHPEIPYFDNEHVIVGGATGVITGVLFGIMLLYAGYLERALSKIKTLEMFLPICSSCKKIRMSDGDPTKEESWESVEAYFMEHTSTTLTHGLCPTCAKRLYPNLVD